MTSTKLSNKGLLAAVCAAVTWGMAGIFIRWLPGLSPFAVLAGRFLVATVAMLPIFFLIPTAQVELIRSLRISHTWWLSLTAIAGYVLGTTAFQMAPVGDVTLLLTTSPLFVIAYRFVGGLRIEPNEGIGAFLATAGSSFILGPQVSMGRENFSQIVVGYLLALGASAMVALYTLIFSSVSQKSIAPKSINVVFVTCLLGGILSLLGSIVFSHGLFQLVIDQPTLLTFIGLGALSTALPLVCYTMAAQRLPMLMTAAILLLEPVFAALFASLVLHEIPSPWFYVGAVLVLCGLLLIAKQSTIR